MLTLTVNIASKGTQLSSGGTSSVGHMYYVISNGSGATKSAGFAPNEANHGRPGVPIPVPGKVYDNDASEYITSDYSTTFEITQEQYDKLKDFADKPEKYGFDTGYSGLNNSCIDFTWEALDVAGLNPSDTEGDIWPTWNSNELKELFDDQKNNGLYENHKIDPRTKSAADAAKAVLPPRRDPLTFDLDGDGLETTAIAATNPILFDHDGDGIKNGTGWVKPDDAFLVLDKNGNGTIDNGRELFGDNTIKSNGQLATDGFDALADLDSNADNKIDANDAQFANLRLWRDLNQDGISQSGELFTLSSQGVASINLAKTETIGDRPRLIALLTVK